MVKELTQVDKEELALALILWKEFKYSGKIDIGIYAKFSNMAEMLGVKKEAEELLRQIPPLKIVERYPMKGE